MCGISGIYGREDPDAVKRMCDAMIHRGPDDEGIYTGDGITLGVRRLSIIDLSPHGHQPMGNEDGTIQIVFNGEIYNFKELGDRLKVKGHRFNSKLITYNV